jgi:hypothetical protein
MVIDQSIDIPVTSKDRLFTIDDYLTSTQTDDMLRYVHENLNRSFDRSMCDVNLGLKGDSGKYNSFLVCEEISPQLWKDMFKHRTINDIPLDSVMVNVYKRGDFIPPHKDKQASIFTVTVPLQTSPDMVVFNEDVDEFYQGDPLQGTQCVDVKGRGYGFYGNAPVHWVPEVTSDTRITLICLYGPMTY